MKPNRRLANLQVQRIRLGLDWTTVASRLGVSEQHVRAAASNPIRNPGLYRRIQILLFGKETFMPTISEAERLRTINRTRAIKATLRKLPKQLIDQINQSEVVLDVPAGPADINAIVDAYAKVPEEKRTARILFLIEKFKRLTAELAELETALKP